MRVISSSLILGALWLGFGALDAHAYLDPGTGSAILQAVIGAVVGLAITLKLYWHRVLRFLGLKKGDRPKIDSESTDQS